MATGSTSSAQLICRSCGTSFSPGRRMVKGILQGIGYFLMVPFAMVVVALLLGPEAVGENMMFLIIAWIALGFPMAGKAVRDGFRRDCPSCGSDAVVALASEEGERARHTGVTASSLTGHTGKVTALLTLADGRLASAGADATVRLWDVAGGRDPVVLTGHSGDVTALAELPDGRVTSASKDKTVRVWDFAGSGDAVILTGHEEKVTAVAALSDGRVASADKRHVMVWDPSHPEMPPRSYELGKFGTEALISLADDRVIASGWATSLWMIDPSGAREPTRLEGHVPPVQSLALLTDGRIVCGEGGGAVRIVDLDHPGSGDTLRGGQGSVTSLAVLPGGLVAAGSLQYDDRLVRIWDLTQRKSISVLKTGAQAMAVLPDGRLATSAQEKTIHLWDIPTAPAGEARAKVPPAPAGAPERTVVARVAEREPAPPPIPEPAPPEPTKEPPPPTVSTAAPTSPVAMPPGPAAETAPLPPLARVTPAAPVDTPRSAAPPAPTRTLPEVASSRPRSRIVVTVVAVAALMVVVIYALGRENTSPEPVSAPVDQVPNEEVAAPPETSAAPAPVDESLVLADAESNIVVNRCGIDLTFTWWVDPTTAPPIGSEVLITLKDARGQEWVKSTRLKKGRITLKYHDGILNGGGTWSATVFSIGDEFPEWPPNEATYDQPC